MGGIAFDLLIVLFLAMAVAEQFLGSMGVPDFYRPAAAITVVFAYFTASWASPMRATPVQFLFGMRVVDEVGARLSLGRAALRSFALLGLVVAALALYRAPSNASLVVLGLVGHTLLFLAVVTPNRQAAHDLLTHTIVVDRTALVSPERRGRLRAHVADKDPNTRSQRRPSISSIIGNVFVLLLPVFLLTTATQVANDKNMRSRIAYAVSETAALKRAVEAYQTETGRFPANDAELGVPSIGRYPDGGFYELEDKGIIRIRFEVRPELINGSIVLRLNPTEQPMTWRCRAEGDIGQNYMPAMCRN